MGCNKPNKEGRRLDEIASEECMEKRQGRNDDRHLQEVHRHHSQVWEWEGNKPGTLGKKKLGEFVMGERDEIIEGGTKSETETFQPIQRWETFGTPRNGRTASPVGFLDNQDDNWTWGLENDLN